MKKLNFIIKYGLALLLLSFYSCESWLNVTPSDRLSEEMLFNDREGFVKALNGVYIELNTNELYGRNLTAGALDVMGQYYSVASSSHAFYNYGGLVYTGNDEKALFDNMWQKCYAVIACCNTIIEKCDENKAGLSEIIDDSADSPRIGVMIIIGINFHRNISIEVLVSGISDRSPQFQHIQPTGPFQKMFVVDIPSKSHRPGIGKKFVHPENGSPVCPPVGIQQITVVISITEIHIIAGRPFLNILIY